MTLRINEERRIRLLLLILPQPIGKNDCCVPSYSCIQFTLLHSRAKSSNAVATAAAATTSTVKTKPLAHPQEAYLDFTDRGGLRPIHEVVCAGLALELKRVAPGVGKSEPYIMNRLVVMFSSPPTPQTTVFCTRRTFGPTRRRLVVLSN